MTTIAKTISTVEHFVAFTGQLLVKSVLIGRWKQWHVILSIVSVLFGVRVRNHWWLLFRAAATTNTEEFVYIWKQAFGKRCKLGTKPYLTVNHDLFFVFFFSMFCVHFRRVPFSIWVTSFGMYLTFRLIDTTISCNLKTSQDTFCASVNNSATLIIIRNEKWIFLIYIISFLSFFLFLRFFTVYIFIICKFFLIHLKPEDLQDSQNYSLSLHFRTPASQAKEIIT